MLSQLIFFVAVSTTVAFRTFLPTVSRHPKYMTLSMASDSLGGKVIVTGIGKADDDEFTLNLLNEQKIWSSVVLATGDSNQAKKKFLSRTARYSGLLNILEFADVSETDSNSQLKELLTTANSWIAFNVNRTDIVSYAELALNSGVKRLVLTTELPLTQMNDTSLPEFTTASKLFEEKEGSFTGIRHGAIIDGNEDNPYEIVNSTIPVMEPYIERGVLGRVVAELLLLPKAANTECGISSASQFAQAYLSILRSSGLTRSQEIEKMFTGGLQRVAQLTVNEYEAEGKRAEEAKAKKEQLRLQREQEEAEEAERAQTAITPSIKKQLGLLDEEEQDFEPTDDDIIAKRATEIMLNVWAELEARMATRSTSKAEFLEANREQATVLATKELQSRKNKKMEKIMELRSQQDFLDKYVDATRRQYAKLLNMERKEIQNQQQISDTWIKYIYLLLEMTMRHCNTNDTLFYNMDEFGQTILLREQANKLRAECSIEAYEVIYDPLDASVIVPIWINTPLGKEIGLDRPAHDILSLLEDKYGKLLKSVPALRGATQIINLAIETLKKELPPPPPTVQELKATESQAKQEMVSQLRYAAMRNRGKPISTADNTVGKL